MELHHFRCRHIFLTEFLILMMEQQLSGRIHLTHLARRFSARAVGLFCACLVLFAAARPALAAEKSRIHVDDYQIDATLDPKLHKLSARARVKFTAVDDVNIATFDLNNALRLIKVSDEQGHALSAERVSQDSTVRISLPAGLAKNASTTLDFEYEGVLSSADDSPVQGLKLAYVGDDTSYLLYAGRWFPVNQFGVNRFTSTISITVPSGITVIGSGKESSGAGKSAPASPAAKTGLRTAPSAGPMKTYTFVWDKPSFPGTIIAGQFEFYATQPGGMSMQVYFKPNHKALASEYSDTAIKEFQYFSSLYGPPVSYNIKVVELPDDAVPSAWAPEIAAIASRSISEKVNYRLLANTVAHQWWGATVSAASKDDFWIPEGFARYSEARYIESVAGESAFEEAVKDMEVGALAYDSVPLSSIARLDLFSPEFQSMVTDKGAIILNMLRWVMGDVPFDNTMRGFLKAYAGKSATGDNFRTVAEQNFNGQQLTWFFSQWLDSTGAPDFKNKYTVYRTNKGFRVTGEISQDLDLFRMPVELKIDTDGKTEMQRIEVVGTNSPYSVETFGRPRRITIDPGNWVLKNSPDLKVRTSIMRGQQLVQQGDFAEALKEFQKALESNKNSSLAHYRIAEVFFLQRNYQSAANEYRESINGDGDPRWTEVWSYIQLGKIFDLTGQRERAVNSYRQALQTNDNTQGAMDEARKYLQAPYQKPREASGA